MHPCHPCLRPYKYEQGIHVIMMSLTLISLTAGIQIKHMERRCRTGLDAAIAPLTSTVPAETDAMPIPVYDGTDATAISSATESTEPLSTASEYRNKDRDNSIPAFLFMKLKLLMRVSRVRTAITIYVRLVPLLSNERCLLQFVQLEAL